jgi:hypothetical protein
MTAGYSSSTYGNQFFETEYRRNFGQYKTSDPAERQQMARSIIELKTKNKEGLSYSTLFEHGRASEKQDISVISTLKIIMLQLTVSNACPAHIRTGT